ncbi:MAG: response regulator [Verrucomicrobia bacterium]|nr:response regulator [Verrucomicrobiota bacterium]
MRNQDGPKRGASILIVEDDPRQIRLYLKALRGHRLTCVANASTALVWLAGQMPDLILLDHVLAGGERGADFLPRLKELAAHVPVIIISGTLDLRGQLQALQGPQAAHYVIEKPVDLDELEATVQTALDECGLAETIRALESLERSEQIEANEPSRRFVERLARQHEILKRLRGNAAKPNISQLARDFSVSRKTILRDLHDLIQRGQLAADIMPANDGPQENHA